VAKPSV